MSNNKFSLFQLSTIGVKTREWMELVDAGQLAPNTEYEIGVIKGWKSNDLLSSKKILDKEEQEKYIDKLYEFYSTGYTTIALKCEKYVVQASLVINSSTAVYDMELLRDYINEIEEISLQIRNNIINRDDLVKLEIGIKPDRTLEVVEVV